jgi:predicted kinase
MRMKTFYLLCGMPFSGKTTLAKSILQHLHCSYISLDFINQQRGLNGGEGIPVTEWEKTHSIAINILHQLMPTHQDVILDDTNCFRWLRDRYRILGQLYNYQTIIIYLDIPLDEIRSRMQENEESKSRLGVKQNIVDEMAKTFEQPQESSEFVIRYSLGENIQDWIVSKICVI